MICDFENLFLNKHSFLWSKIQNVTYRFFRIRFFFEKLTKRKSTIKLAWHYIKNSMQNRISLVRPTSNSFSLNFHFADETWPITVGYIIICQAVNTFGRGGCNCQKLISAYKERYHHHHYRSPYGIWRTYILDISFRYRKNLF